jgi:hypothetical protein
VNSLAHNPKIHRSAPPPGGMATAYWEIFVQLFLPALLICHSKAQSGHPTGGGPHLEAPLESGGNRGSTAPSPLIREADELPRSCRGHTYKGPELRGPAVRTCVP